MSALAAVTVSRLRPSTRKTEKTGILPVFFVAKPSATLAIQGIRRNWGWQDVGNA
jgi:hypothetical protein